MGTLHFFRYFLPTAALAGAVVPLVVACGGSDAPTATPTAPPAPAPTATSTPTATAEPAAATPTPATEPGDDEFGGGMMGEIPPAEVSIEGSTLVFRGDTEESSYERMLQALRSSGAKPDTLLITSLGGDTVFGRKIGEWVFDNGVDVVVERECISSCANYIFTAGKNKTLRKGAVVGWHGSDQQDEYLAQYFGITLDEYLKREFDGLKQEEAKGGITDDAFTLEAFKADNQAQTAEEQRFLKKIGVDVRVMVYGLLPGRYEEYEASRKGFWTFSIEDMGKFGIGNVRYEGEGVYPDAAVLASSPDVHVFTVAE